MYCPRGLTAEAWDVAEGMPRAVFQMAFGGGDGGNTENWRERCCEVDELMKMKSLNQ